jgi:hypothetical protein
MRQFIRNLPRKKYYIFLFRIQQGNIGKHNKIGQGNMYLLNAFEYVLDYTLQTGRVNINKLRNGNEIRQVAPRGGMR